MMMSKAMGLTALVGLSTAIFLGAMTPAGAVCSNGLDGVQSTSLDVCCTEGCTICGGTGCTPSNTTGLTSADCCATEIVASGVFCEVSEVAPCIVTSEAAPANSTCDNGLTGVQDPDTDVCCPLECGDSCGGEGCGSIPGVDGSQCCASLIQQSGVVCSETIGAPCVVVATGDGNSTCSNGLSGIEDEVNLICCDSACGMCGGEGCGDVPGLTAAECCSASIEATGTLCSITGAAPCIVDPPTGDANATCSNGLAGVEDDDGLVCCEAGCGLCGGSGCGNVPGFSSAECCSADILANGTVCSITNDAPCIVDPPDFTPSICPNGLAGVQDGTVCCAEECNLQCGGAGCGSIAGTNGASDCCSETILQSGVMCELGVEAPCIMVNGTYTNSPQAAPTFPPVTTIAPSAGDRDIAFTSSPTMLGDVNGDSLVNSADTGIVGDTNGDGVVDENDTGIVGDTNGDGVVNSADEIVGASEAPTLAPSGAPVDTTSGPVVSTTGAPTISERDVDLTPSPADINGDGLIDSRDEIEPSPAPSLPDDDADADAAGNAAVTTAVLPSGAVYVGALGVAMACGMFLP